MSDCEDCHQNKNNDGVDTTAAKKPIEDGLTMITLAATTTVICFGLRLIGMRQGNTLLSSTSFAWLMSLPVRKV